MRKLWQGRGRIAAPEHRLTVDRALGGGDDQGRLFQAAGGQDRQRRAGQGRQFQVAPRRPVRGRSETKLKDIAIWGAGQLICVVRLLKRAVVRERMQLAGAIFKSGARFGGRPRPPVQRFTNT